MTPQQRKQLIDQALAVRALAHAPYSNFQVGAAVLAENGRIYVGCNVENASYGLTICAERAAVFQAIANGAKELLAVAVVAKNAVTPCGACRQVLAEFADDLSIVMVDPDHPTSITEMTLKQLLPHRFTRR